MILVRGTKKKPIAWFVGIAVLLAGTAFWLVAPSKSPSVPPSAPMFSSVGLVKTEDSAAQNEATKIARGNKEGAPAIDRARVFACDYWADVSESEMAVDSHQKFLESWDKTRLEFAALLMHSRDPEHLLVAALIGFDRKSNEHFMAMGKALAADPDNPLTLWNYLQTCSLHDEQTVCQDGEIEKRAVLADGGNGALWGRIAGYRFLHSDKKGAFDALIKANTAPEFNGYFIEQMEVVERGYAAATDLGYLERIAGAVGIAAGTMSNVNAVYYLCKEHAAEAIEWLQSCIDYGKRLESDGGAILSILIGNAIQKTMYEISGDAKKMMEVGLRRRLITDLMTSGNSSDDGVLLLFDEKVMADYIAEWSAHGELRAMQFVKDEVVRLSQQPGYDPCKRKNSRESSMND